MWGREESDVCDETTKGAAGKEASALPIEKSTGAQL